jgi:lauroyl/myristoyl acyltransferase
VDDEGRNVLRRSLYRSNAIMTDLGDLIVHRPRKLAPPAAWRKSDLVNGAGLAALLLPSWLLPEPLWAPVWRAIVRIPVLRSRREIKHNADNIKAALGESVGRRAEAIARDLKAAVYELCMQDLRAWRPGGWRPKIMLEGEDHLQSALARKNGVILWVAPFVFNSGPTKIALHQRGHRVAHLSSPRHGFSRTRLAIALLNRIRCIPEDRYLSQRIVFDQRAPSAAMRRMIRALEDGEIVSIVATSAEGSELIKGPIFGGSLLVGVGAPRLAALTRAPLLPLFTVRDPEIGFRIIVDAPIKIAFDRSSDERCVTAVTEYLERSGPWVRKFPEQWRGWSEWRRA